MPPRLLTPRRRFALWAAGVGAPLLAGGLFLADDPVLDLLAATGISLAIALMWWLLETTPPDAIKLRPRLSRAILAAGFLWFVGALAGSVAAGVGALALWLACALLSGRIARRSARPRPGGSPWRGVWAWSPAAALTVAGAWSLIIRALGRDGFPPGEALSVPAACVSALCVARAFGASPHPGRSRRPRLAALALGVLGTVLAFAVPVFVAGSEASAATAP